MFAFCQCHLTLLISALLHAHSLGFNDIGNNGATKLAAVLRETKITTLKCATAREVFAFVSVLSAR